MVSSCFFLLVHGKNLQRNPPDDESQPDLYMTTGQVLVDSVVEEDDSSLLQSESSYGNKSLASINITKENSDAPLPNNEISDEYLDIELASTTIPTSIAEVSVTTPTNSNNVDTKGEEISTSTPIIDDDLHTTSTLPATTSFSTISSSTEHLSSTSLISTEVSTNQNGKPWNQSKLNKKNNKKKNQGNNGTDKFLNETKKVDESDDIQPTSTTTEFLSTSTPLQYFSSSLIPDSSDPKSSTSTQNLLKVSSTEIDSQFDDEDLSKISSTGISSEFNNEEDEEQEKSNTDDTTSVMTKTTTYLNDQLDKELVSISIADQSNNQTYNSETTPALKNETSFSQDLLVKVLGGSDSVVYKTVNDYGPANVAISFLLVLLLVSGMIFVACKCLRRRRPRSTHHHGFRRKDYKQEKEFLLSDQSSGRYISDRVTLLDDSSEDEF